MSWEPQAPDRRTVVAQLAQQFPEEWRTAHTGQPGTEDFVKRLAWVLHQEDPRWGLNGKRGTSELSDDVIAYLNPTVDFAGQPHLKGCEAFDIIGGAGGPNPTVEWNNITDENGSGSLWITPEPVGGTPPQPPQPPQPDPTLVARVAALEAAVSELRGRLGAVSAHVSEMDAQVAELQLRFAALKIPTGVEVSLWGLPVRSALKY